MWFLYRYLVQHGGTTGGPTFAQMVSLPEDAHLSCTENAQQRSQKRTTKSLPCVFHHGARQRPLDNILQGKQAFVVR
jgi:hypothetical protein